jgi:histidinol-phosphate aminotransferase
MRRLWRAVLDGVTPYEPGKPLEQLQLELGLPELIGLSANESPLGPSPRVIEILAREARRAHLYPDGGASALRHALAGRLDVTPEWLILGNGADELLGIIAWAAFEPGNEVVIPHPSFEPYRTVTILSGARAVPSPLADYAIDLADVARRVTGKTKAVMLCSPHNPCGTVIRRQKLAELFDRLGDDPPLVILDEAYRDFSDDPETADGIAFLSDHPTLIVLRTFSKIAGLAGLRVGYAVARPSVIGKLNRVRAPYNVNRLAQAAALAALEDQEHWEKTRQVIKQERAFLSGELSRRGFRVIPSQANFLLVEVRAAGAVREHLLKSGILVREGDAVGFPGHLRITVGSRPQNQRLLERLDRLPGR